MKHVECELMTVAELSRRTGLSITEIKQLADAYLADRDVPIGPKTAAALDRAEQRVEAQLRDLEALRRRIAAYRADNEAALTGHADFAPPDPRAQQAA
jgi:DNA-binding transcriptional MerR regulator